VVEWLGGPWFRRLMALYRLDEDRAAGDQGQTVCRCRAIAAIPVARKASDVVEDATVVTCITDREKGRPANAPACLTNTRVELSTS
jgi:hypothetical protein